MWPFSVWLLGPDVLWLTVSLKSDLTVVIVSALLDFRNCNFRNVFSGWWYLNGKGREELVQFHLFLCLFLWDGDFKDIQIWKDNINRCQNENKFHLGQVLENLGPADLGMWDGIHSVLPSSTGGVESWVKMANYCYFLKLNNQTKIPRYFSIH